MSPSAEERLAALENEKQHDQVFQKEVRETLKKLPGRIARRTQKQIETCQQTRVAKCRAEGLPLSAPAPTPVTALSSVAKSSSITSALFEAIDPKNIVKLLLISIVIGGLIGGFAYQYNNPDRPVAGLISQQGIGAVGSSGGK